MLEYKNRALAWEIYVQLNTRFTHSTDAPIGTNQGCLNSLYAIFGECRASLIRHGLEGAVTPAAAEVFAMLNDDIRPFTSRWHNPPPGVDHDKFLPELTALRKTLAKRVAAFKSMANV